MNECFARCSLAKEGMNALSRFSIKCSKDGSELNVCV